MFQDMEGQFTYSETTHSIEVSVTPRFIPEQSNPEANYFFYAYNIVIKNHSLKTVQLISRHWVVRDGNGLEEHITGEGVVGERPVIYPDGSFEYTSACPLRTRTGNMRGTYLLIDESEQEIIIVIPLFFLRPPLPLYHVDRTELGLSL